MWLIIFLLCIIASYGGMPEPWCIWIRSISVLGLIVVVVARIGSYIKSETEYKKKHRHPEGRPPITPLRYGEKTDSPWRKKELMKWNRQNPGYLYEGPCNESPSDRAERFRLLTPEQMATISFRKRILIRNEHRHRSRFCDSHQCTICGNDCYRDQAWCSTCNERYKKALSNGWGESLPPGIDDAYKWVLWRLQQIVAQDMQDGVISETVAKAEMKEVVKVAKQEIADIKKRKAEEKADIQYRRDQQVELNDIVQRLS